MTHSGPNIWSNNHTLSSSYYVLGAIPGPGMLYIRCNNPALNIRYCVSPCLSDETLKAVGHFYMVSMSVEVKDLSHTGVNV